MKVHRKHKDAMFMCPNCGKLFLRKEFLRKHEANCHENNVNDLKFNCRYCEKQFKSKSAKKFHERSKHRIEMDGGYILIAEEEKSNEPQENICKVCPIPQKFNSKQILKRHMTKMHLGRKDLIKSGKFTRYLTENEIRNQESK